MKKELGSPPRHLPLMLEETSSSFILYKNVDNSQGGVIVAKDDYYIIVTKILVYLYKKYKQLEVDQNYILPMTKDFPIQEQQLFDTIEMMIDQGLIKGNVTKAWGGEIIAIDYASLKILPGGIDYLQDNSKVRKICETLKEAKEIFSLFI